MIISDSGSFAVCLLSAIMGLVIAWRPKWLLGLALIRKSNMSNAVAGTYRAIGAIMATCGILALLQYLLWAAVKSSTEASGAIVTLTGNLLLGAGAFGGVLLTAWNLQAVERQKREYADAGVRRQVRADLKRMTGTMVAGASSGRLLSHRWKPAYNAVRDRLMEPGVATAFTDAASDSIYDALEAMRITLYSSAAIWSQGMKDFGEFVDAQGITPEDFGKDYVEEHVLLKMRETYADSCIALRKVWQALGDGQLSTMLDDALADVDAFRVSVTTPPSRGDE